MSNKINDQLVDMLSDDIIDFQEMVGRISEVMQQTPEEVIRQLVNSKWDIRECLNDEDIVSVSEGELNKLAKEMEELKRELQEGK